MAPSTAESLNSSLMAEDDQASFGCEVSKPVTESSTALPRLDSAIQSHSSSLGVQLLAVVYTVTVVFSPLNVSRKRSFPPADHSCRMCDTLIGNIVSCDG